MEIEIKHKHQFIVLISIAVILALLGFVFLHVVFNAGEDAIFIFIIWEVEIGMLMDLGFACLGTTLVLLLFAFLELAINTRGMVNIRIKRKR